MKSLLVVALLLIPMSARAQDQVPTPTPDPRTLSVVITPAEQAGWDQIPTALQQCVGALLLKADHAICESIHTFVSQYAAKMKAAK